MMDRFIARPPAWPGLNHGLELLIDSHWSPDQALAVIELLEDLRDRIWTHYEFTLLTRFREDRLAHHKVEIDDPPF